MCGNFPKTLENAQKHTCNTDIVYTSLQVAANAQLDKIVSTSTIIYVPPLWVDVSTTTTTTLTTSLSQQLSMILKQQH